MLSSKSFIVSGLTFKSLTHLEFVFVYGVRKCSNFIFFTHSCPVLPASIIEEAVFSPLYIFSSFVKDKVQEFIFGPSILFLWSIFLFLCQYHTVVMTVPLQYNLKSRSLIPPALFFFPKIAFVIEGPLWFHTNYIFFVLGL